MEAAAARQRASVERQMKAVKAKYPVQAENSVYALAPDELPIPPENCRPMSPPELSQMIKETATRDGLTPDLLRAVINKESAFNPCAV